MKQKSKKAQRVRKLKQLASRGAAMAKPATKIFGPGDLTPAIKILEKAMKDDDMMVVGPGGIRMGTTRQFFGFDD